MPSPSSPRSPSPPCLPNHRPSRKVPSGSSSQLHHPLHLPSLLSPSPLSLTLFILLLLPHLAAPQARNLSLAIFLPGTGDQRVGPEAEAAVNWTIERLNRKFERLFQFHYHILDTQCDKNVGLTRFFNMMCKRDTTSEIHAVIGPACDVVCEVVGPLAGNLGLPVISNGCWSSKLSERSLFPTFLRTSGTFSEMKKVLEVIFNALRWARITIVHGNGTVWLDASDEVGDSLKHSGFQIRQLSIRNPETLEEDLKKESEHTRVFLLLAYDQDVLRFMQMADQLGLTTGTYAFVTVNLANSAKAHANMTHFAYLDGLLDVTLDVTPRSALYQEFISEVLDPYILGLGTSSSSCAYNYEMGIQAALLSDAITLYAEALNATFTANGNLNDSVQLVERLFGASIEGVSGNVTIDTEGKRVAPFMVHNIQEGCYVPIGTFDQQYDQLLFLNRNIVWSGGSEVIPADSPACGWNGELCPIIDNGPYIIIGLTCTLVPLAAIIAVCFLFRRRYTNAMKLKSSDWKISPKDLKKPRHSEVLGDSGTLSSQEDGFGGSRISIESTDSLRSTVQKTEGLYYYNGQVVMVKTIHKPFGVAHTANLSKELNLIRQLDNRNINPFIGACTERGHVSIVSAYCRKGSLYDIIHKSDLDFDCMFIAALSADISRGLHYLHNSVVGYHGRFKSRNVLVDSTFTCKLGDIHMPNLRDGEQQETATEHYRTGMLWSAPEVVTGHIHGSEPEEHRRLQWQRADMWSFGVILFEIITRRKPFPSLYDSNPEEAVRRLEVAARPDEGSDSMLHDIKQRPHCSQSNEKYLLKVIGLLSQCWQKYPELRITSGDVSKTLRDYGKEHGVLHTNFYQNMLHMMAKNEEDLGRQVRERTLQLETEKNHTKRLLNEMLPAVVADQLLSGVTPPPEYFESVTVFFSDIVQFTQLAASCAPLEVMEIINALYAYFDQAIDNFNVYKVETIGDAYMVASGLPQRNGDQHAGAIAAMALALLSGLDTLVIPYKKGYKLQVRVGIHSGPVVAGVVGTKMPRYCLFGDTVNTASRMESHGLPLKIQISKATKMLLENTGGFIVRLREDHCIVKGKGEMETYWLLGHDPESGKDWTVPRRAVHTPSVTHTTPTPSRSATPSSSPRVSRRRAASVSVPATLTPTILLSSYTPVSASPASVASVTSTPCVTSTPVKDPRTDTPSPVLPAAVSTVSPSNKAPVDNHHHHHHHPPSSPSNPTSATANNNNNNNSSSNGSSNNITNLTSITTTSATTTTTTTTSTSSSGHQGTHVTVVKV
ncbi:atrial natriuretic peptide receptor 2-like [Babylonia areolata]|uniref:atrial natriuretic peptide receptor 2-like n=1 Tax=Babylonia areolata TaxID=304850 RepID=UPI003FD3A32A